MGTTKDPTVVKEFSNIFELSYRNKRINKMNIKLL